MAQKYTHRIFEDSVDKLVHDRLYTKPNILINNDWENFQQKLRPTQKNKTGKTIAFALLFMLLGGTATYWYTNTTNESVTKKELTDKTNTSAANTSLSTTTNTTIPNETDKTSAQKQLNTTTAINETTDATAAPIYVQSNEDNSIVDKPLYTKNVTSINSYNRKNKSIVQNANKVNASNITNQTNFPKKQSSIAIDNNDVKLLVNTNGSESEIELEESTKPELATPLQAVTVTPIELPNPINGKFVSITKSKQKRTKERQLPEHSFDDDKIIYVEAYSGVVNSTKNQNSFAAFLAPNGYTKMRLQQEKALSSVTAGINVKVRKKHITLTSGLSYLKLGDKINYTGDTLSGAGPIAIKANGKTNFTYLEIPVLVGYEWANKRWGFNIQAGVSAGLLTSLSGQYVSIDNFTTQLFDVTKNKQNFRRSVFNLLVSPQFNYYFNSNSNIFIAPTYRRNLQAITKQGNDLQQKYNTLGVQVGIRTRLK